MKGRDIFSHPSGDVTARFEAKKQGGRASTGGIRGEKELRFERADEEVMMMKGVTG